MDGRHINWLLLELLFNLGHGTGDATDELGPMRDMGLVAVDLPGPMDMGLGIGCCCFALTEAQGCNCSVWSNMRHRGWVL